MPSGIKFGTDGWRAIIAEDYTYANVRTCAQAVAEYLRAEGKGDAPLVVGYDTRFASEGFAAAVAEVAGANGLKVRLAKQAIPTPVTSFAVLHYQAGGGVVVTASHNPGTYNGFKYKPDYAGSASPEVVAALEERIEWIHERQAVKRRPIDELVEGGQVEYVDPSDAYLAKLNQLVDLSEVRGAGLKVVAD